MSISTPEVSNVLYDGHASCIMLCIMMFKVHQRTSLILVNNSYNIKSYEYNQRTQVSKKGTFCSVLRASSRLLNAGMDPPSITPIKFFIRTRIWKS